MSRSGYNDDCYDDEWQWAMIRWRGAVASAIRGKRGQAFLRELLAALDQMQSKRLIAHDLVKEGEVCALGALGYARGVPMDRWDPEDIEGVAGAFRITDALAKEIVYENDEVGDYKETPERRYKRMRNWVASLIKPVTLPPHPENS